MKSIVAVAMSIMLFEGGCVGDDTAEKVWTEEAALERSGAGEDSSLIDGPPPHPWIRVSGDPEVKATYMVAAGDLQELVGNNVIIGYIDLYTNTYSFGPNSGKMAVVSYWQRTRGVYPDSSCTGSSPYDHSSINVDANCPQVRSVSESHWDACPVHVMKGWGGAAPESLFGIWSASATEVHFSWNVNGVKKKDYWFVRKKLPRIHYLELDGTRSNGPDTFYPSERTHGFAVGSNKQFNTSVPLSTAMATYNSNTFYKREYIWNDGQVSVEDGTSGTYAACNGRTNELWWRVVCDLNLCGGGHAHTQQCYDRGPGYSENLNYWSDPWPAGNNRKNAFWQWHACHVPVGSCYHGGSHAYPMLQAIDDTGAFYGWVGIEHQRDNPSNPGEDDLRVTRQIRSDLMP